VVAAPPSTDHVPNRPVDAALAPIDVVIPVYNAPELTRRCIASLYRCIGPRLGQVLVHDNASGAETRAMLDALDYPGLSVHHAAHNSGFGGGVNQPFALTKTELVLVLNSDVAADGDFLTPLVAALRGDPTLVAVTPAGNTFGGYDLRRYVLRSGCVVTHNLYGYAFLIRRDAFLAVGGFDPAFGLGFFEDTDLSRKLIRTGYWLGIHPGSSLHHEIHGSFEAVPSFRDGIGANREIYLARYPGALRNVVIASGRSHLADLPAASRDELDAVLRGGGSAHWLTRGPIERLPALEVRADRASLAGVRRTLRRYRHKAHRQIGELWLAADAPRLIAAWLARWARAEGAALRRL
jgi:GT2 family glycosyltransferase